MQDMENHHKENKNKTKFVIGDLFSKNFEPFFYQTKYISLVAVIGTLLLAIILFYEGFKQAIVLIITMDSVTDFKHLKIDIIGVADMFLFGMAMLIISFGTYKLFIGKLEAAPNKSIPIWLQNINNFGNLKIIVAKIVVLVLILIFLELIIENFVRFKTASLYELLVIPVGVLLISYGLKVIEKLE